MQVKSSKNRKGLRILCIAWVAIGWAVSTAYSAPTPPPTSPPAPVLTEIVISGPESIDENTTAQYICTASYSDNTTATVTPNWSEDSSDATISGAGELSVSDIDADQNITITANYSGKTATHAVTAVDVPPVLTGIVISGPSSVNEETTAQYVCNATYSDGSSAVVTADWSENSSFATIAPSGLFSALNVSADAPATITASFNGETDTHAVTIKYVVPSLTGITISGPSSMDEETTAQYLCTASYSDGTSSTVTPDWSENSSSATINSSGMLTAGDVASDQNVTISASYGGRSDSHATTIKYIAPELTGIVVSGPSLVDEETAAQYVCTATYSDGTSKVVTPAWSENSSFATIGTSSGQLSAGNVDSDQSVTVSANYGGETDAYFVTISYVAPPVTLTSLAIAGPENMEENATVQYICTAYYSDGTSAEVNPSWSEDSAHASISGSGLLTIGNVASDEQLTVRASLDGKSAAKSLAIAAMGDQVIFSLSGFDGKTVSAQLWDDVLQVPVDLGEEFEPEEIVIENVTPGQWYWLGLREYDAITGDWVLVHGRWFRM